MAVQKSRKSRSRRNSRRAHTLSQLFFPTLTHNSTTKLTHHRHHMDSQFVYRSKNLSK